MLIVAMIESPAGVELAEGTAAVPGVGVVFAASVQRSLERPGGGPAPIDGAER